MDENTQNQLNDIATRNRVDALEKQVAQLAGQVLKQSEDISNLMSAGRGVAHTLEEWQPQINKIAIQVDARPEVKVDAKGLVANLLSVFQWLKRKK